MRIAYLRSIFPLVSNTFIMEEVASLAALGHDVRVFADHPGLDVVHAKVHEARLFERVRYVDEPLSARARLGLAARLAGRLLLRRGAVAQLTRRLVASRGAEAGAGALADRMLRLRNVSLAWGPRAFDGRDGWVPDVIHVPFLYEWEAAIAARLQRAHPGVPLVAALRAVDLHLDARLDRDRAARFAALARADRLVTIARFNARIIAQDPAFDAVPARADVSIVHSALDTDFFAPRAGVARRPRQIACVARLVPIKGLHHLIVACRLLVERGHDVRCVIVGEGYLRSALAWLAVSAGVADRVTFAGVMDQAGVRDVLATSEVFALPCAVRPSGDRDVLPNSLKEAMAMELPVVTSDVSGIEELVHHDSDGLLVPADRPAALADAIDRLFGDAALRERLGRNARRTIVRDFETRTEAGKLAAVLAEAVRRARSHSGELALPST